MKKLLALVLSCTLFLTAFMGMSSTVSATGNPITFTAQSVTAKVGDIVTVDISVSENHYMVNGQLLITYDPAVLEIQAVSEDEDNPYFEEINRDIFKSSYMWAFSVPAAGKAKMAFATSSTVGTTAGGVMFTLTFKVLEDATNSTVTVSVYENDLNVSDGVTNDGGDYRVDVSYVDGIVTIETDADTTTTTGGVADTTTTTGGDADTTTTTGAQTTFKPGDVNGDGNVDLDDAVRLFYYVNALVELSDDERQRGNVVNPEDMTTVDLDDAVRLFYAVNDLVVL